MSSFTATTSTSRSRPAFFLDGHKLRPAAWPRRDTARTDSALPAAVARYRPCTEPDAPWSRSEGGGPGAARRKGGGTTLDERRWMAQRWPSPPSPGAEEVVGPDRTTPA